MTKLMICLIMLTIASGCAKPKDGTQGSTGPKGEQGQAVSGSNGSNGHNSLISSTNSAPSCPAGGITFLSGIDLNNNNILDGSEVTQSSQVCNGATGSAGPSGSDGGTISFSLVQPVMPCGAASSPWKEVILGLAGGQLLASFSDNPNGLNTRFSFVPNGTYNDTDSSGCQFTVSGNGSTSSQISWPSGSNAYSTWAAGGYNWTQSTGWVVF